MSNQLVYKGHYFCRSEPELHYETKIYSKKGLAVNNTPSGWYPEQRHVVEYELVPTGRRFNMKGELIERLI